MRFQPFNILLIIFAAFCVSFAQKADSTSIVYGMLFYEGKYFLITSNGIISEKNSSLNGKISTNYKFEEYYKSIYGKNTENPNFVIDGTSLKFIPYVNLPDLMQNNNNLIDGISYRDFAELFLNKNFIEKNNVILKLGNYLSTKK